ncbi:MAG: hypothetical protein AAF828_02385 [Bacteroidota bacterium]
MKQLNYLFGPGLCTLILLACLVNPGYELAAQNGVPPLAGNRGRALGGTGLTFRDAYAAWSNPAGLAGIKKLGINLAGEQRFGLSELQLVSLGAGLKAGSGGFGLTVQSFGFSTLRENRIGLAYGRSFTARFRGGVELVGLNTSVENYESRFAATFGIGLQVDVLPNLMVGFRGFSLLRVETAEDEFLPQLLAVGIGYRPNEKLVLLAEVHQDLDFPARFRGGMEYAISEQLDLRIGVASGPTELSFGAGFFATDHLRIEVAASYHETLGLTPGVGLAYRGK